MRSTRRRLNFASQKQLQVDEYSIRLTVSNPADLNVIAYAPKLLPATEPHVLFCRLKDEIEVKAGVKLHTLTRNNNNRLRLR